jgi:hypothetical protein
VGEAQIDGRPASVTPTERGVVAIGTPGGIPAGSRSIEVAFEGRLPTVPQEVGIFYSSAGSFALGGAYPGLIPLVDGAWTAYPRRVSVIPLPSPWRTTRCP